MREWWPYGPGCHRRSTGHEHAQHDHDNDHEHGHAHAHEHGRGYDHDHDHDHGHGHDHEHAHAHAHAHAHEHEYAHDHEHDHDHHRDRDHHHEHLSVPYKAPPTGLGQIKILTLFTRGLGRGLKLQTQDTWYMLVRTVMSMGKVYAFYSSGPGSKKAKPGCLASGLQAGTCEQEYRKNAARMPQNAARMPQECRRVKSCRRAKRAGEKFGGACSSVWAGRLLSLGRPTPQSGPFPLRVLEAESWKLEAESWKLKASNFRAGQTAPPVSPGDSAAPRRQPGRGLLNCEDTRNLRERGFVGAGRSTSAAGRTCRSTSFFEEIGPGQGGH
eukprot:gene11859-biopygen363